MHATSRTRSPRTITLAASLAALLLVPTMAFADEHEDDVVELPSPAVDDENVEESPQTAVAAQVAACEDLLVTHSPDASEGNELAVAITAQAVEAGLDGWINVAWEAAEGTTLRTVLATELDGSVTELPGDATGSAFDVLSLTFCGTFEPPAEEEPAEEEPAEEVQEDPEPAAPSAPAPAPSAPAPAPAPSSDGTQDDDTPDDDTQDDGAEQADEADEAPEVVTVEPQDASEQDDDADETEITEIGDEAEDDGEAEVLGVQLTRDDEADGGLGGWVIALAVLALLGAGTGALVWSRRS